MRAFLVAACAALLAGRVVVSRAARACAFSGERFGEFDVQAPGCKLSQMVTVAEGKKMAVVGRRDASVQLPELQAVGSPASEPDGNDPRRHFLLATTSTLELSNLKLTMGRVSTGSSNFAEYNSGGSIFARAGSVLTLDHFQLFVKHL